eukprot:TRINITY_DN4271_c0_g1_i1.p1 TRINITY_DN4271_c0_g1~~TRINITY_DN4271_c0_g1_i1.p1  ORF type:complete len:440 (+),score=66.27 TRINITY_DN4271_c0_g1_i1:671-1990(+)
MSQSSAKIIELSDDESIESIDADDELEFEGRNHINFTRFLHNKDGEESEVDIESLRFDDEGLPTLTSIEQKEVEAKVIADYFSDHSEELLADEHISFLLRGLKRLSSGYVSLDASRTWLCYWIIHSLDLLDALPLSEDEMRDAALFLGRCQNPSGGFGGGPGQLSHLAPCYSGMNTLVALGTDFAYDIVDRKKMLEFLISMKSPSGGFYMHKDGEIDMRGTYCAVSVASILNILTPELVEGAAEYIVRCQTYEGGLGAYPGNEAHGGFTFCGLAAMMLMGKAHMLNLPRLLKWTVSKQMTLEQGFQGRTNKLVDSCYSFWVGALFPLVQYCMGIEDVDGGWLFDQQGLQNYIIVNCQDQTGGFRDKPGKSRDYYHTCYALSGMSISQYKKLHTDPHTLSENQDTAKLRGKLKSIHPVYNLTTNKVNRALAYFKNLGPVH